MHWHAHVREIAAASTPTHVRIHEDQGLVAAVRFLPHPESRPDTLARLDAMHRQTRQLADLKAGELREALLDAPAEVDPETGRKTYHPDVQGVAAEWSAAEHAAAVAETALVNTHLGEGYLVGVVAATPTSVTLELPPQDGGTLCYQTPVDLFPVVEPEEKAPEANPERDIVGEILDDEDEELADMLGEDEELADAFEADAVERIAAAERAEAAAAERIAAAEKAETEAAERLAAAAADIEAAEAALADINREEGAGVEAPDLEPPGDAPAPGVDTEREPDREPETPPTAE